MIERFNVLRDPWVPVWIDGKRTWVTYGDVLTGEVEPCTEVAYPQDAFRVFVHALLSALTQALFEPKSLDEWEARLEEPLSKDEFEARVREVEGDFELLGEPGWMQDGPRTDENLTDSMVHELSETHRPALWRIDRGREGMSPACATAALYGVHMFATGGGQGYSPSVRGSPPLTTLVRGRTLRETTWANVLVRSASDRVYPDEPARPWALGPKRPVEERPAGDESARGDGESDERQQGDRREQYRKPAHEISLVEGLFWKPRAIRLAPAEDGVCCISGERGPRVRVCYYAAGAKKEEGYFEHPWTPSQQTGQDERKSQQLPDDRPVWSGLADLLAQVRENEARATQGGVVTRCAPVVAQWFRLARPLELYVFAYRFDNASLQGRFFQAFPSIRRARDSAFIERVRQWVALASKVLDALLDALKKATGDSKGDFWLDSARWEYWRRTERWFWDAVASLDAEQEPTPIVDELARAAESLFNEHTEPAELEAKHQRLIAVARKDLRRALNKLRKPAASKGVVGSREGVASS